MDHRSWVLGAITVTCGFALAVACSDDNAATDGGSDASIDVTSDVITTDSTTVDAATLPSPSSLTFLDFDPEDGGVDGIIYVGHAADESSITSYAVYYGSSPTQKLQTTPITTIPKAAPNPAAFMLTVQSVPSGAAYLLAYAAGNGIESAPIATKLDRTPAYVDIFPDAGTGNYLVSALDSTNHKLLVLSNVSGPRLTRCELDGTGCTTTDISGGVLGTTSQFDMVVDSADQSLVIAWASTGLYLARCDLTGASCTYTDSSTGKSAMAAIQPTIAIDHLTHKVLVAAADGTNGYRPVLYRCNVELDAGAACTFTDISAGAPAQSASSISKLALDGLSGKLLLATDDLAKNDVLSLFRCNWDGTSCEYLDVGWDAGGGSGLAPTLDYDNSDDSISMVVDDEAMTGIPQPVLVRCNGSATACTRTTLANKDANTFPLASALDDSTTKLLVPVQTIAYDMLLLRCARDGGDCRETDMLAGHGAHGGMFSTVVADPASNIFVVGLDESTPLHRPALYLLR